MNTIGTKQLLLLAAAALATAACDPFPAPPSGPLEVFHVGVTGGNPFDWDFTVSDPAPPDPMAVVVDDVAYDASFYVWFTKEMDGTTIQQFPDVDPATGLPTDVPNVCEYVGSPLEATSSGFPAGTSVCYAPGSATGGGLIQVFPPDWWQVGSYVLAGTVKDVGGASIAFNATFNVTLKPTLVEPDPYTIDIAWPEQVGATDFTIERIQSDTEPTDWTGSTWQATAVWADPSTTGVNGILRDTNKEPGTTYWYRITANVPGATPSTATSGTLAAPPAIKAQAKPVSSAYPNGEDGVVQIVWSRIRGADYRVERSSDGGTTWTALSTEAASTASTRSYRDTGVAPGTYTYRIVPVFSGTDGVPTKTATATMT